MDDAQQSADRVQPPYPSSVGAENTSGLRALHSNTPVSSLQRQHPDGPLDIDLSDWVGHRILAKRPNRDATCHYYWPGVIHSTYEDTRSVAVRFDGEENTFTYDNVLSTTRKTIVSDVIPSTNQVSFLNSFSAFIYYILIYIVLFHVFVTIFCFIYNFRLVSETRWVFESMPIVIYTLKHLSMKSKAKR